MFEDVGFHDFKISVKHHDVITMVETYRLLASKGDWPLHLGVTEAGPAWQGTINPAWRSVRSWPRALATRFACLSPRRRPKRSRWVGKLLDTWDCAPASSTSSPARGCGRAQVDVIQLASAVTEGLKDVTAPIRVAVMGCIVNGPGEAREADLGVASGNGKGQIFIKARSSRPCPKTRSSTRCSP